MTGPAGIYIANADLTGVRFLVAGDRPAWSPDGTRIAFQRDGLIHLIGIDGTGATTVGLGEQPAWSPDGKRLVFVNDKGVSVIELGQLAVATLVSHHFRAEVPPEADAGVANPAWSPDGTRIVFQHQGDWDLIFPRVYVMDADGANLQPLLAAPLGSPSESGPSWSPDGASIVLVAGGAGIAVVPLAGGPLRNIHSSLPAVGPEARPGFRPDGGEIYFSADPWFVNSASTWVVDVSGGRARPIIDGGINVTFAPDGGQLAFVHRGDPQ